MVFLNGEFLPQKDAKISTLDRGFLFGDGVYEVIPVYNQNIFKLTEHLNRLDGSLRATKIKNPFTGNEYKNILTKLLKNNFAKNQTIYLQITRGVGESRSHNFKNLTPTIYIRVDELKIRNKNELVCGFKAIITKDIRWNNCYIKSTSLLTNVLYVEMAQANLVEEIILEKNGIITEGASSNVFILSKNTIKTPKINGEILAGITREMVIKSAIATNLEVKECDIKTSDLMDADEVWISSSTREVMPISQIGDKTFSSGGEVWQQVYNHFQTLKSE